MQFARMKIEQESPEQFGYERIKYNLTESSTTDKTLADVGVEIGGDTVLCYGDHMGKPELRALIAEQYGASPENVMVGVGACMSLFMVYSALLMPGDHIVVMHPNYPANIEIPRSLGCDVECCELHFEENFQLDVDRMISMIRPDTKIVSVTYPHNPTGSIIGEADLRRLMAACEDKGCYLLVDETYGDLTNGPRLPHVSNMSPYGICIESLSKAIGIPGIRIGWVVSKNRTFFDKLLATKEQICICGSILDEECAHRVLSKRDELMRGIRKDIDEKFAILCGEMETQNVIDWVRPQGGVVCFPRIKPEIELDTSAFYDVLNNRYGVFVGPGRWFDMDDRYFRIGYAWPEKEELRQGLRNLFKAVEDVRKN